MSRSSTELSPFTNPSQIPFRSLSILQEPILIVAPHPDDETLGCGGAIALLQKLGYSVRVLVVSDGTKSHPNSRQYPPLRLRAVREAETLAAMALLGVKTKQVSFLRLPDGAIPTPDAPSSEQAITACQAYLSQHIPKTIFLPYRFDPHPDHRATWQLIHHVLSSLSQFPYLVEYPIWDWDVEQRNPLLDSQQFKVWRIDITEVIALKQQAIALYQSQITDLIDDDPEGFRLTPDLLANFTHSWEMYLEDNHASV